MIAVPLKKWGRLSHCFQKIRLERFAVPLPPTGTALERGTFRIVPLERSQRKYMKLNEEHWNDYRSTF